REPAAELGRSGRYRIANIRYRVTPRFVRPPHGRQRRGLTGSRSAKGGRGGGDSVSLPDAEYRDRHTPNSRLALTPLTGRQLACGVQHSATAWPEPPVTADRRPSAK